jgi:uncharacterized protein YndB with AHSA1/START domain
MAESRFVYVTYIRTTPEKLWRALKEPEFTRRYWWETTQDCDWTPGAPWSLKREGRVMDSGTVLEIDPPHRLVLSWRNEFDPAMREEGHSRMTCKLEPQEDSVKLTVTHEMDKPGSRFIEAVSGGWPKILSSLKSLLETGEPLERP